MINRRFFLLLAALVALLLSGCAGVQLAPSQTARENAPASQAPRQSATARPRPQPTAAPQAQRPSSELPAVTPDQLPPEARDTLALIASDGPFPFSRDGIEFQNRERLLPRKPRGYYREYTVITPGSRDRGARRIIAGEDGERYYTEDHYESFVQVIDR